MPLGINFGLRAGASRAVYDAPFVFFDAAPRRDWRLVARAPLGNRKIRVLGLSPQIGSSWTPIESTIGFYDAPRSRFVFTLPRYFSDAFPRMLAPAPFPPFSHTHLQLPPPRCVVSFRTVPLPL